MKKSLIRMVWNLRTYHRCDQVLFKRENSYADRKNVQFSRFSLSIDAKFIDGLQ